MRAAREAHFFHRPMHMISTYGEFSVEIPARARAALCVFRRSPHRAPTLFGRRRPRAALRLQNSPARFLHGPPPYPNVAVRRRRHRSTICGWPALPRAVAPPQPPRQSTTASAARPLTAAIHFIQMRRKPARCPGPRADTRPGPQSARRSGAISPVMLPFPERQTRAPVAGTAPHDRPTLYRSSWARRSMAAQASQTPCTKRIYAARKARRGCAGGIRHRGPHPTVRRWIR